MQNSPLQLSIRLDWSEMDYFGHINNVMFYKYIQASRIHFFEHIGVMQYYENKKIGPVLRSCSCEFYKTLHYPGEIKIQSEVEFLKNSSLGLRHKIYNAKNELCAEAKDIIVLYDFKAKAKFSFPDEFREKIVQCQALTSQN